MENHEDAFAYSLDVPRIVEPTPPSVQYQLEYAAGPSHVVEQGNLHDASNLEPKNKSNNAEVWVKGSMFPFIEGQQPVVALPKPEEAVAEAADTSEEPKPGKLKADMLSLTFMENFERAQRNGRLPNITGEEKEWYLALKKDLETREDPRWASRRAQPSTNTNSIANGKSKKTEEGRVKEIINADGYAPTDRKRKWDVFRKLFL